MGRDALPDTASLVTTLTMRQRTHIFKRRFLVDLIGREDHIGSRGAERDLSDFTMKQGVGVISKDQILEASHRHFNVTPRLLQTRDNCLCHRATIHRHYPANHRVAPLRYRCRLL